MTYSFKSYLLKKSIIGANSKIIGRKYNISDNIKRFVNGREPSSDSEKISNCYKLVYEINFDCSKCLIDLKEINDFFIELSKISKIEFCLVTKEKSYGYIKFYLDELLKNYDLWIVQQEFTDDNTNLYLIDSLNRIVMAGDIIKYPFLKDEYRRKLKIEKQNLKKR